MAASPYDSPEQPGQTAAAKDSKGCGWVPIAVSIGIILPLISLILPGTQNISPGAARRTQCRNNLKQIALALHSYHDEHNALPPAYTVDETGRPLHSWRTLILPFLDHQNLYESIDLSKPWDANTNKKAGESRPATFTCPSSDLPEGFTTYMAIVGEDYAFHPDRSRIFAEFTDDTSSTLMVMEVPIKSATHWMNPKGAPPSILSSDMQDGDLGHSGGINAAMADGSVQFLATSYDIKTLHSMLTIAADDDLEEEPDNDGAPDDQE